MVNVGLGWSSIVGILLAASGLALYFLRSFRPKLARDHDIFFAAVALLCGGILFFQGWRQDPILQFGQFLLTGSAVFFAVESIRLRSVTTEQAKRTTPIVDDERPVSRVYKAELDDLDAFDQRSPIARRIRGSRDTRSERNDYRDEYDGSTRRRTSTRPDDDRYEGPGNSRRRRPRIDEGMGDAPNYFLEDDQGPSARRSRGRGDIPPESTTPSPASRSRRPRSSDAPVRPRGRSSYDEPPSQYVEYRPVDNDDDSWGDE
ncbi:Ycf66 family protein [Leptodesmis sp.]|uniref:Ycf66 family protein n=1 Tax=Leptodesmis sp. TaxID=3100501 RepID=UPI0040535462